MTINSSDTSISKSTLLDYTVPASKIASLSSGVFVGIVADNPEQKIKLMIFHSEMQNDHAAITYEEAGHKPIPVIQKVTATDIQENYLKIKADIENLFFVELALINAKIQVEKSEVDTSIVHQANGILSPDQVEGNGSSLSL